MPGQHRAFRFDRYDVDELRRCGAAICDHLQRSARRLDKVRAVDGADKGTRAWTKCVLTWFANSAGEGLKPYSRYNDREFMFDLVHATWDERPWSEAIFGPCKLRLVLESEWGKSSSPSATLSLVLDDAAKIAVARANAKVMLFGSCKDGHRKDIADALARLRRQSEDPAPWLWVDVPWRPNSNGRWEPVWDVLT